MYALSLIFTLLSHSLVASSVLIFYCISVLVLSKASGLKMTRTVRRGREPIQKGRRIFQQKKCTLFQNASFPSTHLERTLGFWNEFGTLFTTCGFPYCFPSGSSYNNRLSQTNQRGEGKSPVQTDWCFGEGRWLVFVLFCFVFKKTKHLESRSFSPS